MIVRADPCKECGECADPTEVQCDYCGKKYEIETYEGMIIHFDPQFIEDEEGNEIEVESDESLDYHFCGVKCMVEYLNDPQTDGFSEYEERNAAIFMASRHVNNFLALLGRG
jgi:RNA polymerase subunit RPABC4/transcription elongation factor Spt4